MPLLDASQRKRGELLVYTLPGRASSNEEALLDERDNPDRDLTLEPIQLMEGIEYRFAINTGPQGAVVTTDRPDIFQPDDDSGSRGRLRPGMRVGALPVRVYVADMFLGEAALEVRSHRLDYMSHYRWMLRDIAEQVAEALMERFAGTEQRFTIDESADARTLYQRFAFIKSLLEDERFVSAMRLVLNRPYVAWHAVAERRRTDWGVKSSAQLGRQLRRPGPRVRILLASDEPSVLLPKELEVQHSVETVDNSPNRLVKFALEKWRAEVLHIAHVLAAEPKTIPVKRGQREVAAVLSQLNRYVSAPLFADVTRLRHVPSSNPVMARKEGYRDIYSAHIQSEMAAQLAWEGGEDVYGAGQRNVAALYEYWVFLRLAATMSRLCDQPFDLGDLLEIQENGLNLVLARTAARALVGRVTRRGRRLNVQLWFNRTFPSDDSMAGSWTRAMRPDCSLLLQPTDTITPEYRSIWVHFDAKYRAEALMDVLGSRDDSVGHLSSPDALARTEARRADLLKMHAYRDAIRRSAGAYVVYPGTEEEECREYHELLPGLGAFGLRPSLEGPPLGEVGLERFLEDVLEHAASQVSQHERERYWTSRVYSERSRIEGQSATAPFLERPPADSSVLLGYVKDQDHLAWIEQTRLYNLRADERRGGVGLDAGELTAEFVVLYGHVLHPQVWKIRGEPRVMSDTHMRDLGYPRPGGKLYFCLPVEPINLTVQIFTDTDQIRRLRARLAPQAPWGGPVVVSWIDILTAE